MEKFFSIDFHNKSSHQGNRIKIYKGSQIDADFLNNLTDEIGDLDVIIDDGSQINEHVIETFKILFPKLKNGEVYVIENSQSSYWEKNGRASKNLNNPKKNDELF